MGASREVAASAEGRRTMIGSVFGGEVVVKLKFRSMAHFVQRCDRSASLGDRAGVSCKVMTILLH